MSVAADFRMVARQNAVAGAGRSLAVAIVLSVQTLFVSGCTATPQQQLQGRWYNDALSIRFRPDGTLIMNSVETGLISGRFYFDGELRSAASESPVSNLTMDLVIDGRVVRWQHEAQFLGDERMRLQPTTQILRGRPSDGIANVIVLRKAAEEGDALAAAGAQ